MTELVRLKVGAFDIAHAWTLAQIQEMAACGEEEVLRHIVPVEEMLSDYPEFKTTDAFSDKMLANGNWLPRNRLQPPAVMRPLYSKTECRCACTTAQVILRRFISMWPSKTA